MKYSSVFNTNTDPQNKLRLKLILLFICVIMVGISGLFLSRTWPKNQVGTGEAFQPQSDFRLLSKAAIQNQIRFLVKRIESSEKNLGYTGIKGAKIYSAKETDVLLRLYQAINWRLDYLNNGYCNFNLKQWDGYDFDQAGVRPYNLVQVNQILFELASRVPPALLRQLKIFLLPYSIKDVAGLGGAGYDLISAYPASESSAQAVEALRVTLVHEIGHHIHLSFMPENSRRGRARWNQFLKICGGTWHGPGQVNTKAWNDSSEETFAEYFRMLFGGKNQPFFGDITLGDPRTNPDKAKKLIQFVKNLAGEKSKVKYRSPWLPDDGLTFWEIQNQLLFGFWLCSTIFITNGLKMVKFTHNIGGAG